MPLDNTYARKYWYLFEITRLMLRADAAYQKTGSFADRAQYYRYKKKVSDFVIKEVKKRALQPELF